MAEQKVFDPNEWFADITEGVEVSDETAKVVKELLAQDAVRKNVGNSVLRQSDYSRKSDALGERETKVTESESAAATKQAEGDAFVAKMKDRDHNNLTLHDSLVADLNKANARLSDVGEEPLPRRTETQETKVTDDPTNVPMTVKEYEAREAQRDNNTINYSNRVIQLSNKFRTDFGKDFDPAPVVKHATDNQMTLDQAYDDLYSEQYAEKTEAEVKARIETAVKEKEIELRSNADFPEVDSGPKRVSGLDQAEEDKLASPDDRVSAAVKGLAEIRSGQRDLIE